MLRLAVHSALPSFFPVAHTVAATRPRVAEEAAMATLDASIAQKLSGRVEAAIKQVRV